MKQYFTFLLTGILLILSACDNYLDVKPRSNLVLPETLDDFEQLLDYGGLFNSYPDFLELQSDDFYFEADYWNSMYNQVDKNVYVWTEDIYGTTESHNAWSSPYSKILYANAVLEGLETIKRTEVNNFRYNQIKGTALFLKAESLFLLAQLFCKVYDKNTAATDLGVPIPMSADVNEKVSRPSNQVTFDFITNTLLEAEKLLSPVVDFSRPSQAAAHALLARVFLYMGDYDNALIHSDQSLEIFDDLVDLKKVSTRDYKNTILMRIISPSNEFYNNIFVTTLIDTVLIKQYKDNDLRKGLLFEEKSKNKFVKNDLHGLGVNCFSGIDTDEQYLIRAECYARDGKLELALADINHLLEHRFEEGEYIPYSSIVKEEVLDWVLQERRKELAIRGHRWSDLKRFNRDGANITLKRVLGDQVFTLTPNDPKWVLPIPTNEINISKIQQNER